MGGSTSAAAGIRESGRVEGIDAARGLAALIMIQGHAYNGWVAAEHRDSAAYGFTRLLGTLPLPAFLVLAGAAVAWRVEAAAARGESAWRVRRRIVFRGLQILLYGYVTSAVYMAMDGGHGLDTLLRADVLHVIGLGILTLGLLGVRPRADGALDRRWLTGLCLTLATATVLLCPTLTEMGRTTAGPARYLVGLFVEVPGVTRMPFVPLFAWLGAGAAAGQAMAQARRRAGGDPYAQMAGAPRSVLFALFALGLSTAAVGTLGTTGLVNALGGPLTRSHPAIWANALDLAGRGLLVLATGALAFAYLPGRARKVALRLGRGSLVAYVFHIPFCYGTAGTPVRGRLDMVEATLLLLVLIAASYGAVLLRDTVRDRLRARKRPRTAVTA